MIRTLVQQGRAFRALVGIYPYGTNPGSSNVFDQPHALRQTVTLSVVHAGGGDAHSHSSRMGVIGPLGGQTGVITVASNDFSAMAEIFLGNYRLLANVDFVVGAAVGDTATNIAAAINQFPGFSASVNMAAVTVLYSDGSAADVDFRPLHYGEVVNFTFVPDGLMTKGNPQSAAPIMT